MADEEVYDSDEGPADDPRWVLLRKLAKKARIDAPSIRVNARRRGSPIGFATGAPPELQELLTITIETDARVPLTFILEEVRSIWRHMKTTKQLPERSRPLEDRKIALLEFVCLTHPNAEWSERFERWNKNQPRRWRYANRDAFTTACHDAEKQLTGSRSGLRWFYDPHARMAGPELARLGKAGDRDALREQTRRLEEGVESIERAGIRVVRYRKGGAG